MTNDNTTTGNKLYQEVTLLTPTEVAKILRVHVRTIHRYLKAGKLLGYGMETNYRIPKSSVDKFLEDRKL